MDPKHPVSETDWNIRELMERLEDDHEFFRELLVMFREDSLATLDKARHAMALGDFDQLSRAAHTMKGMLKNLAMNASAEIAAELEQRARDRQPSEELLVSLDSAVAAMRHQVEAQLAEVKA